MSNEITMPKLSDTMEEGKILRWLKRPGDKVARGEALAEVETDKADMVLESFEEGVLDQIKLNEGESAPVGAVIAIMKSLAANESNAAKESKSETKSDAKPATPAAMEDPGAEAHGDLGGAAEADRDQAEGCREKRVTEEIDRAGRRRDRRLRR